MYARTKKGFTLIETMIVILIISILIGIAIPSFINSRSKAKARACAANLREINQAKEQLAMAKSLPEGFAVNADDLQGYLRDQAFPACPTGGLYTIGAVGESPTCSIGASSNPPHTLTQS